jgi:dephospho-CoA kinase
VRVGFTGAGATGKSTVIREIALLSDCPPILTSVARGVFAERGLSSESQQDAMTPAERWDLQM